MMINTIGQDKRNSINVKKGAGDYGFSMNNELSSQTFDQAGQPKFMRAGSGEYEAQAIMSSYMNEDVAILNSNRGQHRNSNSNGNKKDVIPVTKLVLTDSNGSDSGLERLPCGSDTYFDRSFDSDIRNDYIQKKRKNNKNGISQLIQIKSNKNINNSSNSNDSFNNKLPVNTQNSRKLNSMVRSRSPNLNLKQPFQLVNQEDDNQDYFAHKPTRNQQAKGQTYVEEEQKIIIGRDYGPLNLEEDQSQSLTTEEKISREQHSKSSLNVGQALIQVQDAFDQHLKIIKPLPALRHTSPGIVQVITPPNYSKSDSLSAELSPSKASSLNVPIVNITKKSQQSKSVTSSMVQRFDPSKRKMLFKKKLTSRSSYILEDQLADKSERKRSNSFRKLKQDNNNNNNNLLDQFAVEKINLSRDDLQHSQDSFTSSSSSSKDKQLESISVFGKSYNNETKDKKVGKTNGNIVEDILTLYGPSADDDDKVSKCIIMRNNKFKLAWDIFVLSILLIVSMLVPVRLAFATHDPISWLVTYTVVDSIFAIDLILTFFTSISDENKVYEITNKKFIAKQYLKGWFWIDLISIFPVDALLLADDSSATMLARFAKIGKLYKLIRMIRLAKVFKLLKSKNTVVSQFSQKMKISQGVERLMFFSVFFILFFHISACMFIFAGHVDYDTNSWMWDPKYNSMEHFDLYVQSFYFIVTTTSTVGYGDLSASTLIERIFCILIMLAGVTSFTFISGSLSSVLSNYDSSQATLQQQLLYLNKLSMTHNISDSLINDIRKALQYDSKTKNAGLDLFISKLPAHLRLEVSEEIHKENFKKFEVFMRNENPTFLAWIASRLKQQLFSDSTFFYQKGDAIDNIYFAIRGVGAFIMTESENEMFCVIDPELFQEHKENQRKSINVLQYFGGEDLVINTAAKIHDKSRSQKQICFHKNGFKQDNRRYFSVQSIQETEVLLFSMEDLDKMKRDFPVSTDVLFQQVMNQTKKLLSDHLYALKTFKSKSYQIYSRFRSPSPKKNRNYNQHLREQNLNQVYKLINDTNVKKFLNSDKLMPDHSNLEWTEDSVSTNKLGDSEENKKEKDAQTDKKPSQKENVEEVVQVKPAEKQKKRRLSQQLSAHSSPDILVFQSNQAVERAQNNQLQSNQGFGSRRQSVFGAVLGFFTGGKSPEKDQKRRQTLMPQKSMNLMQTPEKDQIQIERQSTLKRNLSEVSKLDKVNCSITEETKTLNNSFKSRKTLNSSIKRQQTNFKNHIKKHMEHQIKRDKRIKFILPKLNNTHKNSHPPPQKRLTSPVKSRIDHQNSAPLVMQQKPPRPRTKTLQSFDEQQLSSFKPQNHQPLEMQMSGGPGLQHASSMPWSILSSQSAAAAVPHQHSQGAARIVPVPKKLFSTKSHPPDRRYSGRQLSGRSLAHSEANSAKRVKQYAENSKQLAARLMREKPEGIAGLQYVLVELRLAQQQGLIPEAKKTKENGKFANIIRQHIGQTVSKQDKDRELIRVIKTQRREILQGLMKDNAMSNENILEERIEDAFNRMADQQKLSLDQFFERVEKDMQNVQDQLNSVKKQVQNVQEKISRKKYRL